MSLITRRNSLLSLAAALALPTAASAKAPPIPRDGIFNVKDFGARGDGVTVDSPAINAAVKAANQAGGGTVLLPPGHYISFSIRLLDHVTLLLSPGSILEAADPAIHKGGYDLPESSFVEQFQDFGITQFHCSLIYADGATDIAVLGRGLIYGKGLLREDPGARWHGLPGYKSPAEQGLTPEQVRAADPKEVAMNGKGIRSIGLKSCRNIRLADFSVLQGGHFSVHLLGCSNAVIEGLTIDTNRDGIDIDCCHDVRVAFCVVNSPKDDAIVVKSSYALDRAIICENITITGCKTSGYAMGSVLDGTYGGDSYISVDSLGVLGRIKLGTESNGGFRNVLITDCTCENSRGILVGIVDGGTLEDVTVSNITLRRTVNHPLFIHHAARLRAPAGTGVGTVRKVLFENVTASEAAYRYPCGFQGVPDAPMSDISFSNIHVTSTGGGTAADAALTPPDTRETSLEVSFMKTLPAFGFYGRHARNVSLRDVVFAVEKADARPAVVLDDVVGGGITGVVSPAQPASAVVQKNCRDITVSRVRQSS